MTPAEPKRVLIVGGGFGGIRAALDLAQARLPNLRITLVSDKGHFEYHAALYRLVAGSSPREVCVPLVEIFDDRSVALVSDRITAVDPKRKRATGQSGQVYEYDWLILALGSQTTYFHVPGLAKRSFGFKSITEAVNLKQHLHEILTTCPKGPSQDGLVRAARIVVVGGGASGVEMAGELAITTRRLARAHGVAASMVAIDLIEAGSRVLASLPEEISTRAEKRLRQLKVNLFFKRTIMKADVEKLYTKDMTLETQTIIWTPGTQPNELYQSIPGLSYDKKGRVEVGRYLQAEGVKDIFVIGDAAATLYSGMAQTALLDGRFVAQNIVRKLSRRYRLLYKPRRPAYVIPIGPGWAVALVGGIAVSGRLGWWVRRFADWRFFTTILPVGPAWRAFRSNKTVGASCPVCDSSPS